MSKYTEEQIVELKPDLIEIYSKQFDKIFKPNSNFLKKHFLKILTSEKEINKLNQFTDEIFESSLRSIPNIRIKGNINKVSNIISTYYKYHNLFKETAKIEDKGKRFNIINETDLEIMYDKMQYHIEQSELKQYAKSFVKSYKHLINEETLMIFKSLKDDDTPREIIAKEIRKIAAFQSSKELNSALKKILSLSGKYSEKVKAIIEENNLKSKVVFNKDGVTIVEIDNFNDANKLGTSQWCICYEEEHYNDYLKMLNTDNLDDYFVTDFETKVMTEAADSNNFEVCFQDLEELATEEPGKHYFLYNDNLDKSHNESMIAFTIGANEELSFAFDKEDNAINKESILNSEHFNKFLNSKKPILEFNLDEISNKIIKIQNIDFALSPHLIITETRNPLSVYVEVIKKNQTEISNLFIIDKLYKKSAEDLNRFKEISPEKYIKDCFFLLSYLNKNFVFPVNTPYEMARIYDEDEDNAFDLEKCVFTEKRTVVDFLKEDYFKDILNQLNEVQKKLIYKSISEDINKYINKQLQELERFEQTLDKPNSTSQQMISLPLRKNNESLLYYFGKDILNDKNQPEEVKTFALQTIMETHKDIPEKIEDMYFEKIKNKNINIEKAFDLKENENFDKKLATKINNEEIKLENYLARNFKNMFRNHIPFLKNLNQEFKKIIREKISKYDIESFSRDPNNNIKDITKYDLGEKLHELYKENIITKEHVEFLDDSFIKFGDLNAIRDKYSMDFKEYILSAKKEKRKNTINMS